MNQLAEFGLRTDQVSLPPCGHSHDVGANWMSMIVGYHWDRSRLMYGAPCLCMGERSALPHCLFVNVCARVCN
jgi:hypothetical protein